MLDLKFKSNLISNVAVGRNRTTTNRTGGSFKNLRGRGLQKRNKLSLPLSSCVLFSIPEKSEGAIGSPPLTPHASTGHGPKRKSDIQRSAFSTIIRSNPLGSEWRNESNTASMMAPSSTENRNSKTKLLFHSLLFSKVSQRENQRGKRIQKRS